MSAPSPSTAKIRKRIRRILKQKTMREADIAYLGKQMASCTNLEDLISPEDSGLLLTLFNNETRLKQEAKTAKKGAKGRKKGHD